MLQEPFSRERAEAVEILVADEHRRNHCRLQCPNESNRLPIHTERAEKFRNPNGVTFKLANLRAVEQPGSGAKGINRLDRWCGRSSGRMKRG